VGDVALVVDTFPERADPGPSRIPPEPQRELSIIVEQHHERPPTFTLPTPPPHHAHSVDYRHHGTACSSDDPPGSRPVVRSLAWRRGKMLTILQLVDSTPHHSGHGTYIYSPPLPIPSLTPPPDPNRHPPPLRHDAPPIHPQKSRPPQNPTTAASTCARTPKSSPLLLSPPAKPTWCRHIRRASSWRSRS
jgi:hypothetical protein